MKEWLILGLGNPILGDDGVGWKVADEVKRWCAIPGNPYQSLLEIEMAALGGLSLMERMIGYKGVILIDAIYTGNAPPGSVSVFPLRELQDPFQGHSASTHDTTLMIALDTGRSMSLSLPSEILIVAIEAQRLHDFTEALSEQVAAAIPIATHCLMELLQRVLPLDENDQKVDG
jgi:hydrogenase maturation protease